MSDPSSPALPASTSGETRAAPRPDLPPAAQRALAEAEARRAARETETIHPGDLPPEVNGRKGAEPVRYGDWEKNGIISDF
ncbi:DUF1674 domain-containing protein [Aureimonas sp. AU12]|uniref:DUF1674 domain-containing protein n=1 Tax=Aureimonas sp. AU12 TaxID=1638161 RepID=UPI0009E7F5E1|nr:succinate dehydrogenase assembly factor 4 [Aureimonas sp. AU12]